MRVAKTLRRLISGSGKSQGSLSVRSETPNAAVEVSSRVTEEVETKNTPGDTDTQVHSGQSTGENPKGVNNTSPSKLLHLAATKSHLLPLTIPPPAYAVDPLDVALTVGVSGMIFLTTSGNHPLHSNGHPSPSAEEKQGEPQIFELLELVDLAQAMLVVELRCGLVTRPTAEETSYSVCL